MPSSGAEGRFEQVSFAMLLVRALDERWSGTLRLRPPDPRLEHHLEIERGLVMRAVPADRHALLGELLIEAGVVMETEVELALEQEGPLGRTLLDEGLIDEPLLRRALLYQLLVRLVRLFELPAETRWSFDEERSSFARLPSGAPRIDSLRVLWAGVGAHGETSQRIERLVGRIEGARLALREGVRRDRFGLSGEAEAVAERLQKRPCTLAELCAGVRSSAQMCHRLVYVLALTRHLEITAGSESSLLGAASGSARFEEPTFDEDLPLSEPQPDVADSTSPASPDDPPSSRRDGARGRALGRIQLRRIAVRRSTPGEPPAAEAPVQPADDCVPPAGDAETRRAEIRRRAAELERETPFSLLEIEPRALEGRSEEAITELLWEAYEARSRKWHPESVPDELAAAREHLALIHSAMTEAFVLLADPRTRRR
jgi:hypothetical protein